MTKMGRVGGESQKLKLLGLYQGPETILFLIEYFADLLQIPIKNHI